MNAPTLPPTAGWSRPRWLGAVLLVFVAQLAFIWLLGARKPDVTRPAFPTPPTKLMGEASLPLAELNDPTLFALPHVRGFSGQAWAQIPRREFTSADWDEPFRWLPLAVSKLGDTFQQLLASSARPLIQIAEKTEPYIAPLEGVVPFALPGKSRLRIEGGLVTRALRGPLAVPSWPGNEVLAASEVRVIVDADGWVVSATVAPNNLSNKPDQAKADQEALELARTARFESIRPATGLMFGRMIFQWHTGTLQTAETSVTNP